MQLTEEQKFIGRRNFIKAAAVLPAVGAFAYTTSNVGPVKAGIVGTGMEGRVLIEVMNPKYLYLVGSCDIRPDNLILGQEHMKNHGHSPQPKTYPNYEDMLNDPEIEAVVIATPLHMHGPMSIQAMKAGKHVFTEKTMAYSTEECLEMCRVAKQTGLNLQVGHQRFYNPLYWQAYRMFNDGLLGNVYHVRALWHRNTDWNYWGHVRQEFKDQLMNIDPKVLDQHGYKDVQHLVNWRWYQDKSHGLWTELCSHQLAITNWMFNDMAPSAVQSHGGHFKVDEDFQNKLGYEKDDRNIADHIFAIFEYPDGRTVTYSSQQSNSFDQYYEQIMGTFGTIILSGENQYYLFWEPGWDEAKAKEAAAQSRSGTSIEVVKEDAEGSAFAAHVSAEATRGTGGASDMSPLDPYRWELEGFAHTIRTGAPNLCDGIRAMKAAQACYAGQEAMLNKTRVEIPDLSTQV